jgi:cysteinyl-tRNA synthetase
VNIDSEKMSKSLGNFFTIREVLEKFDPDVIRFFLLSTHYRSPLDFSDAALAEAKTRLSKFANLLVRMARIGGLDRESNQEEIEAIRRIQSEIEPAFIRSMNDDFNSAGAIGHLFTALPIINAVLNKAEKGSQEGVSKVFFEEIDTFFKKVGKVIGLFENGVQWGHEFLGIEIHQREGHASPSLSASGEPYVVPAEVNELVKEREQARKGKDFTKADEIRDKLAELGFTVQDTPQGPMPVPIK